MLKFLLTLVASLMALTPCIAADLECKIPSTHETAAWLKPTRLEGDFDNDGIHDIAVLVKELKTEKLGIAVCSGKSRSIRMLGAGVSIGAGGDDFSWMDKWSVHRGSIGQGATEELPPGYRGDALHVEKMMSASGIIFFDSKKFRWYQQGD